MSEKLFRDGGLLELSAADVSADTIRLSFASEKPVLRKDSKGMYWEVLSCGPGDCNLGLLNSQGIVLRDHDDGLQIGEVVKGSARVDADRKARATIKLHDEGLRDAIASGDRPGVSAGYRQLSELSREYRTSDGLPTIRFSAAFFEISILSPSKIPADDSVGLFRSKPMNTVDEILALMRSTSRNDEKFTREQIINGFELSSLLRREHPEGLTREICDSEQYLGGQAIGGRFVPFAALLPKGGTCRRDLTSSVLTDGGAFVQTDMQPAIELLQTHSVCTQLGAQVVSGLKGNFIAPRIEGLDNNPAFVSETAAAPQINAILGALGAEPHRIAAKIPMSRLLNVQTNGGAENFIRAALRERISTLVDRAILAGSGANNEPTGILNTNGVGSVVFGGAATWQSILKFEQSLTDSDADKGSMGWAISGGTRNLWKQAQRVAGFPKYIMERGQVNDYSALSTLNLSDSHRVVFGNWADVIVLIWGTGVDFVFDAITQASKGEDILHVILWIDVLVRHPQSFCVSADAANQ